MTAAATKTARYLPSRSRIAMRDARGETRWYNTREEVPVPDGDLLVTTDPFGRPGVNTIDYKGFTLFFKPEQVRVRMTKDQVNTARQLNLYTLDYDVPHRLPDVVPEGFLRPHQFMHSLGVRSSESAWVLPKHLIPHARIDQIFEVGGICSYKKIDPSEIENTLNQMIQMAQKELAAFAESSAAAEAAAAEARLDNAPEDADREEAAKAYRTRAMNTIRKNQKLLGELEEVCKRFGIDSAVTSDWEKAKATQTTIATTVREKAKRFAAAVRELREIGPEGAAMAAAMEAGQVDPTIAADMLQDADRTQTAEALRDAFNEAAAKTEADGTYSLS